jgi:5-methylcytosine-specific restriction protein B
MDYALRRRFAFFNMEPAFKSEGFKKYQSGVQNAKFDSLIATVERLNEAIEEDKSLGKGFRIGHSYFYTDEVVTDEWLYSVIKFELIPLLEEYWFDEPSKVKEWSHQLMRHCEAQ